MSKGRHQSERVWSRRRVAVRTQLDPFLVLPDEVFGDAREP